MIILISFLVGIFILWKLIIYFANWVSGYNEFSNDNQECKLDFGLSVENQQENIPIPTKKYIYRPQNLTEYIGQEKAKQKVKLNLQKICTLRPIHILIYGKKGCGKTSLSYIIAKELKAKVIERISSSISTKEDVYKLIEEINKEKKDYVVLFIDEIHNFASLPEIAELFYPIMEDFQLDGKPIRPFTLIGATTEINMLVSKLSPLVDRFQVIPLENYTVNEIVLILKQFHKQLYSDREMKENVFQMIAMNCKYTPRIAINLLEDYLVDGNIERILDYNRIIKDGLTDIDFKILETLSENEKPLGEKALSQVAGLNNNDYREVYEPYLCEQGYIIRTARGRTISQKGKELLKEIK